MLCFRHKTNCSKRTCVLVLRKAVHETDLAVNESFAKILIENISDPIEIGNERAFVAVRYFDET